MHGVKPYLAFNGNCEEAVNFYRDCLDGEIVYLGRYADSPMGNEENGNMIMHATLKIGDTILMACDVPEENKIETGTNISLTLASDDPEKMRSMFERMSDGGTVTMPLGETFWSKSFGMLTDKFGVDWLFNCESQ